MLPNVEVIFGMWYVVTLVGPSSILSSFSLSFLGIPVCLAFYSILESTAWTTSPLSWKKQNKTDSSSFHICTGATLSLETDLEPREVTQLEKCLPSMSEALSLQNGGERL